MAIVTTGNKKVILVHRINQGGDIFDGGKATEKVHKGDYLLVDPDTGEILHRGQHHVFTGQDEMEARFNLMVTAFNVIQKQGFNSVVIDTDSSTFRRQLVGALTDHDSHHDTKRFYKNFGIDEIEIIKPATERDVARNGTSTEQQP